MCSSSGGIFGEGRGHEASESPSKIVRVCHVLMSKVTADLSRLLSSVEEATLHFDMELQSVQPAGDGGLDDVGGSGGGGAPGGGGGNSVGPGGGGGGGDGGSYNGDEGVDEYAPLTMATFFKGT